MPSDTLRDIIDAEREIQLTLDRATQNAHDLLEAGKKQVDDTFRREETNLRDSFERSRETAKQEAKRKAGDLVKHAQDRAKSMGNLSDAVLDTIASRHIGAILPE